MQKQKSTFGWVFTFAGQKKTKYIASVCYAVIGAVFQILPFFVMAKVIGKLLASFWDVSSGSITIGGADIRDICAAHYQKLVAYVSQDNFLFDDTIRENIRIGKPDATDAEVEQAAKDCGCYDFIMGLENGFDTPIRSWSWTKAGSSSAVRTIRCWHRTASIVTSSPAVHRPSAGSCNYRCFGIKE